MDVGGEGYDEILEGTEKMLNKRQKRENILKPEEVATIGYIILKTGGDKKKEAEKYFLELEGGKETEESKNQPK